MTPDQTDEELITVLALGSALAFGWIPLGAFSLQARQWMIEHQLLVSSESALVEIPTWDAGLDIWRILLLLLLLVGLFALGRLFTSRRRKEGAR